MIAVHKIRPTIRIMPTEGDLLNIPISVQHAYELSDKECQKTRSYIYRLNKGNVAYKWRTMREGTMLLVARFYK